MTRPNFFADVAALNCLLKMDLDEPERDCDLTLDIVDVPFWFSFSSDEKTQRMKAYRQLEIYGKDEEMASEAASLELDRESGTVSGRASDELGDNIGAFFGACKKLNCLIGEKGLEPLFSGLDPNEAGILLTENNGELEWKVVSGRERPDLTVHTLLGGITTGRPYMEDFMERSAVDMMSLEEKIEAAEEGNTDVMEDLAMLYLNGDDDIEPDPEKSVYWFKKLAEEGVSNGMFNLGLLYAKGHGVKRDFEEAAYWMEKAAEAGDEDAPRVARDYKKLAAAYDKASAGDAQAQADLAAGLMSLGGSLDQAGAQEDFKECVKWARLAAEQGNPDAMWTLALAYEHGRGVDENTDTAIEYYERGASLGSAPCQHSLGCFYARGDYLEKDNKKAFELFQKSAAQGYGLAMRDLGRCYQFGMGCMGNMKTAVEWYEKALKVIDDPELERKTALFKMLGENDEHWGDDYAGEEEI